MSEATDWLATESVKAPPKKRGRPKGSVAAGKKLPGERRRGEAMIRRDFGRDRIWSCDGEYVYFRPTRMVNGVKTVVANPTTYERHKRFVAEGHYVHVETQDDVEVYRVTENSPFKRRGVYLGELPDGQVRRQVVLAACRRDWVTYADALEELFGRIKNRGYDPAFAARIKEDYLNYIDILIRMRDGPTPQECGIGLAGVRAKRGDGKGRMILLPGR